MVAGRTTSVPPSPPRGPRDAAYGLIGRPFGPSLIENQLLPRCRTPTHRPGRRSPRAAGAGVERVVRDAAGEHAKGVTVGRRVLRSLATSGPLPSGVQVPFAPAIVRCRRASPSGAALCATVRAFATEARPAASPNFVMSSGISGWLMFMQYFVLCWPWLAAASRSRSASDLRRLALRLLALALGLLRLEAALVAVGDLLLGRDEARRALARLRDLVAARARQQKPCAQKRQSSDQQCNQDAVTRRTCERHAVPPGLCENPKKVNGP